MGWHDDARAEGPTFDGLPVEDYTKAAVHVHNHPPGHPATLGAFCVACSAEAPARPVASSAGQKADAGKLGTHLLPTRPLEAVARVLDFGASKYAPDNWRKGIAYTRVYGAVLRHLWAWWRGEAIDTDSGQHHLACVCTEVMFLLDYELGDPARKTACDDRPEAGVVPPG